MFLAYLMAIGRKPINTFEKSYDYIITLKDEDKTHYPLKENRMILICKTLSFFTQRCFSQDWLKLS